MAINSKTNRSPPTGANWELTAEDWNTLWDQVQMARAQASDAYGPVADLATVLAKDSITARPLNARFADTVNVLDFGADPTGVADSLAAIEAAVAEAGEGAVYLPFGDYSLSAPLVLTAPARIRAEKGTRITLKGAGASVITFDGTGGTPAWMYGASLENLILDGGGFATDGLLLKAVISSQFSSIRVTNVTGAGLHLAWAQLCTFDDYACSNNIEPFSTHPVNGILADGASSSANTFTNPTVEGVSGAGVKALALINSILMGGTSEGNDIGLEFGETVVGASVAIGNTVIGMDLEVNTTSDIVIRETAGANEFIGLDAGYNSPAVQVLHSRGNLFVGGICGGIHFDADATDNRVLGTGFIGAGRTIVDDGADVEFPNPARNVWSRCFNVTDATVTPSNEIGSRLNWVLAAGETATIDATVSDYVVVSCAGATATIAEALYPRDGQTIDITIHNISGGALTVTWGAHWKIAGWVNPGTGTCRSVRFRYDVNWAEWYAISVSHDDVQNH